MAAHEKVSGRIKERCQGPKKVAEKRGEEETADDFDECWSSEHGTSVTGTVSVTNDERSGCNLVVRIELYSGDPITKELAVGQTKAVTTRGLRRLLVKCEGTAGGECSGSFEVFVAEIAVWG